MLVAERIVYYAKETKKIEVDEDAGVQTMLNALARTPKFKKIARKVADDRLGEFEGPFQTPGTGLGKKP